MNTSRKADLFQRQKADALGHIFYFTGIACKNGHIAQRLVKNATCTECNKETRQRWCAKYPNRADEQLEKWRKANPERLRELARQSYKRNVQRNAQRKREIGRKYRGLPTPTYREPIDGLCECCKKAPRKRGFHLDHDHKTGEFRGWLCGPCNTGIAHLGDSIEGVMRGLAYLQSKQK